MNVNLRARTHLYDELITVKVDIPLSDAVALVERLQDVNILREASFVEAEQVDLTADHKSKAEAILAVTEKRESQ